MRLTSLLAATLIAIAAPASAQDAPASTLVFIPPLPPCCGVPLSDSSIAQCVEAALSENGVDELAARRVQIGTPAHVLGMPVIFSKGDTYWGLCKKQLVDAQFRAEEAMLMLEFDELQAEFAELREEIDKAKRFDLVSVISDLLR